MEYRIRLNEEILSYRVTPGENGTFELAGDDRITKVGYTVISPHQLYLVVDGVGVNAYICPDGDGRTVTINGVSYYLEDADRAPAVKKGRRKTGPTEVTAPMPSVVVSVLTAEGGQGLPGRRPGGGFGHENGNHLVSPVLTEW